LAIVQTLVKKMGGQISLDSEEGEGTTLTFDIFSHLPTVNIHYNSRFLPSSGLEFQKKGIISIGFEDSDALALRKNLTCLGLSFLPFSNPESAISALNSSKISWCQLKSNIAVIIDSKILDDPCHLESCVKLATDFRIAILIWENSAITRLKARLSHLMPLGICWSCRPIGMRSVWRLCKALFAPEEGFKIPQKQNRFNNTQAPSRHLNIAVVDDNPINLKVTQKMLERLNCHATLFNTAKEILDHFRKQTEPVFDAILLDLHMPETDGIECYLKLSELVEGQHKMLPHCFALTASVCQVELNRCVEVGMSGVIPKPISIDELRRKIDNIRNDM